MSLNWSGGELPGVPRPFTGSKQPRICHIPRALIQDRRVSVSGEYCIILGAFVLYTCFVTRIISGFIWGENHFIGDEFMGFSPPAPRIIALVAGGSHIGNFG